MISDLQLIAQVLIRVRAGDQITDAEESRLRAIAGQGYSSGTMLSDTHPVPDGMTSEEIATATRVRSA